MSGSENTTLLVSNLPAHNHVITSISGTPGSFDSEGNSNSPQGNVPAEIASRYTAANPDGQMAASVSMSNTPVVGANSPVSNLSPYLAMNYIIAVEGIFPSRS
jgi:microcystin-dependent protein